MKYKLAELFCGCGGFSRGFTRSKRFEVVLGNDIKPEALRTFQFNHQQSGNHPEIFDGDIRLISLRDFRESLDEQGVSVNSLDCLVGGPPCQGFSQLRRTAERENGKIVKFRGYSKVAQDPRNDLVLRFLEVAEFLKPKVIVIENVPQMLSHGGDGRLGRLAESVVNWLEKDLGYSVAVRILNAANFGVPQLRERAVFMASAIGSVSFPDETHSDPSRRDLIATGRKPWNTVADAIRDLPSPSMERETMGGGPLSLYLRKATSTYSQQLQSTSAFPFNHISRRYSDAVRQIVKRMRPGETWDTESARMRQLYDVMIKKARIRGESVAMTKNRLVKEGKINRVFYKRYYWSAYTRLNWDAPALTITANSNFLGSGRNTHPEELRGITMREAARLQSFDDDFRFITSSASENGAARIGIGMDMIGEAVPPLFAAAIAEKVVDMLEHQPNSSRGSKASPLRRKVESFPIPLDR